MLSKPRAEMALRRLNGLAAGVLLSCLVSTAGLAGGGAVKGPNEVAPDLFLQVDDHGSLAAVHGCERGANPTAMRIVMRGTADRKPRARNASESPISSERVVS